MSAGRPPLAVALYTRTPETVLGGGPAEPILAAHAARRGWTVVLACTDPLTLPGTRRDGLRRLCEAVRTRAIQAVLVRSLSHLARSLRHLTDLGHLLDVHGIALVAVDDGLDTTAPGGALRWRDWLEISLRFDRQLRSDAARLSCLRASGERWGRPVAVVNPLELQTWWEGRGGRRPLSQRALARRLGISQSTLRRHLQALRAAGHLDEAARARALAIRGGLPRGGRPPRPLDDATLSAAWRRTPSVTGVARTLGASRARVRRRLRELGWIEGERPL